MLGDAVRVLVVEDEVKLAALVRKALREQGMLADVAIKGEDALWMAAATPYDVLVLDVNLPGIDGFEVCHRLPRCLGAPLGQLSSAGRAKPGLLQRFSVVRGDQVVVGVDA